MYGICFVEYVKLITQYYVKYTCIISGQFDIMTEISNSSLLCRRISSLHFKCYRRLDN